MELIVSKVAFLCYDSVKILLFVMKAVILSLTFIKYLKKVIRGIGQ
jgi:hypothetical protein